MSRLIDMDEIRIKPEYMHDICGVVMIRVEDIARILNDVPPAQPEHPKGKWRLDFMHNTMTCSECGRTFDGGFDLDNADNFCRHCGSDNRGE